MSDENSSKLKQIIEGALIASGEPLNVERITGLFSELEGEIPSPVEIHAALEAIKADCESKGFELKEVASGFRFQVRQDLTLWVSRLWEERPQRYTRALLETLALIAYRQPITRAEIEVIRGVAVSSQTIQTLQEREWIRVVGHRDTPGRPAMFATTRGFLDYFNLKNLDELPSLMEVRDIDKFNQELQLDDRVDVEPQRIVEQMLEDEEIDSLEEIETTESILDETEDQA